RPLPGGPMYFRGAAGHTGQPPVRPGSRTVHNPDAVHRPVTSVQHRDGSLRRHRSLVGHLPGRANRGSPSPWPLLAAQPPSPGGCGAFNPRDVPGAVALTLGLEVQFPGSRAAKPETRPEMRPMTTTDALGGPLFLSNAIQIRV